MKKSITLLLTAVLLLLGIVSPFGTQTAAAAKSPEPKELATFVNGKLLISPAKSLAAEGSTYVPVKLAAQIPGISVNTSSGIVLTGSKGTTKLGPYNSIQHQNANYVAFKTLLKIGNLDGKYASSANALFIWTTAEGKTKSNAMLSSISQLPGTMGKAVGRKVYVFGYPGAHWITDVSYDGGSTMEFTMQQEDGTIWTLSDPVSGEDSFYTADYLQDLKSVYNGAPAWIDNSRIKNSPFKNMEKVTLLNLVPDPADSTLLVQVRRASGEEIKLITSSSDELQDEINDFFYFKNPRTELKISDKMWKAIQEERVVTGMTINEVYLSWGKPDEVYESAGMVVYGSHYLYFRHNKLAYIL
ncbi:hypothetical protein ACE6ED_14375 [Paenibacillus sp. CN-4]|uniref:hypothetical protein n=1 Tax=Paenibacillus nanchangensis TaxID=3348343 RepID=UPI0039786332